MTTAFSFERGLIKHLNGFGNLMNNDHIEKKLKSIEYPHYQ
jgi:hypothetical protein